MNRPAKVFLDVARWTVVRTTVSGRGHPEPRKRHRKGSMLARMDVRVMLAELIRWKRLASSYKLSLSEFVRARMNNTKIRVVAVTDPALINEYKRHNNNLNQLLHAIHGGFPIDASRVEAVIAALHALYLRDIERG